MSTAGDADDVATHAAVMLLALRCAFGQGFTFAHSRVGLHPEVSARELELAALFDA